MNRFFGQRVVYDVRDRQSPERIVLG